MPTGPRPVAVVTQTRVHPGRQRDFELWLRRVAESLRDVEGALDHTVIEPSPPLQADWVVVRRFTGLAAARAWLESPDRQRLLDEIEPALVGDLGVHLFTEGTEQPSSAVSAVIATQVPPGREEAFLRWHRRMAAVQAGFPGYQGYRLEPPIPGLQDDWVAILRYDSEEHLAGWLSSQTRRELLGEAGAFVEAAEIRTVRSGFDTWFVFDDEPPGTRRRSGTGEPPATRDTSAPVRPASPVPVWKQNMVVLLVLYPVVFLFGEWVHTPLLVDNGVPDWLALFAGNAVSVSLLGWVLVPWVSRRLRWWLTAPPAARDPRLTWVGAVLVVTLYALLLAAFSQLA